MSLRLSEEELEGALVQVATLSAAFLRYAAEGLTYSQVRDRLAGAAMSWDETGDVVERLENIHKRRLKR